MSVPTNQGPMCTEYKEDILNSRHDLAKYSKCTTHACDWSIAFHPVKPLAAPGKQPSTSYYY